MSFLISRRSGILPKSASDYLKKRFGKKLHMPHGKKMDGSQENVNRIITFGSMPSYRYNFFSLL